MDWTTWAICSLVQLCLLVAIRQVSACFIALALVLVAIVLDLIEVDIGAVACFFLGLPILYAHVGRGLKLLGISVAPTAVFLILASILPCGAIALFCTPMQLMVAILTTASSWKSRGLPTVGWIPFLLVLISGVTNVVLILSLSLYEL